MSFQLDNIVPWGRSFAEYREMFSLSETDLQKTILGCGDGPSSFNTELTRQGGQVVSMDPLYRFSAADIHQRIEETSAEVMEQTRKNKDEFLWTTISSIDELGRIRLSAMNEYLEDYPVGLKQGRYIDGELPYLPFGDQQFDLALCSHLLFLYSEHLSFDFHLASILEMCRVASEVRIFPLLELGGKTSRHLQPVMEGLGKMGVSSAIVSVEYEFQRGGNQMMRIRSGS